MNIKRMNYPLILGSAIVLLILIISIFGYSIVELDPYAINLGTEYIENGKSIVVRPESPPNFINKWGTDVLGRDIFSRIIVGTKTTMKLALITTLLRFLIGLPFAFLAGFGSKVGSKIIEFFNKAFSAIPALLISFMILKFTFIKNLELESSIIAFGIVFTLVGWGRLAKGLEQRIKDILEKDFIQGEIAIGKNKVLIALQNVLPHLTATIIVFMFLEISRVLFLIAQLGVLEVYVGKNKLQSAMIYESPPYGLGLDFMPSYDPEWGAMLSTGKYAMMVNKTWMVIYPALAFFIGILGFNLVGEGLRKEVDKRNSMVITRIKKIPFHLSPKTYIYEMKNFKNYKKSVSIKTTVIVVLITILVIPPPQSVLEVSSNNIYAHVEEISKDKYQGRKVGTEERNETTDYIVNSLSKNKNIEPLFDGDFVQEIQTKHDMVQFKSLSGSLKDGTGNNVADLKINENFGVSLIFKGEIGRNPLENYEITLPIVDIDDFKNSNYTMDSNVDVMKYYDENGEEKYYGFSQSPEYTEGRRRNAPLYILLNDDFDIENDMDEIYSLIKNDLIVGVILPVDDSNDIPKKDSYHMEEFFYYVDSWGSRIKTDNPLIVTVNKDVSDVIRKTEGCKLTLANEMVINNDVNFKNVGGIIKGKNSGESELDKLIITTNYDYIGHSGDMKNKGLLYNGSSIAALLEIAEEIGNWEEKPSVDIVFLFFDGSKYYNDTGANFYVKNLDDYFNDLKDDFVISFNNLGFSKNKYLYLDTSRAATKEKGVFEYIKYFRKRANQLGIDLSIDSLVEDYEDIGKFNKFGGKGIYIESLDTREQTLYDDKEQSDINLIDKEYLKKQSQLILDTIINIAY